MKLSKSLLYAMTSGLMLAGTTTSCSDEELIVCPCEPEGCEIECGIDHDHLVKRILTKTDPYDCPGCGMG